MPVGFKVIKGISQNKTTLDSTHTDRSKANHRASQLRNSIRGSKLTVWVVPMEADDPAGYQKHHKERYH